MKYNQQISYQRRKRFLTRVLILFISLIIVGIAIAAYSYYSVVSQENSNTDSSTTSQVTSGYFAPSVKVFRSSFFQFQADNTWVEVPAESTTTKFVYRSLRSNLIEHDLTIYVNTIPPKIPANRVLPVNPKGDSELLPLTVSDHCAKTAVVAKSDVEVTVEKVKMFCDTDSTNYAVLVGQVGGTTVLNLLRPDGSAIKYAILYSNLRATADAAQLLQITESFQTR